MVGLIVIAAFPVNHVPARSTILEFVSHHLLAPQPGLPGSASTGGSRASSGSGSGSGNKASSSKASGSPARGSRASSRASSTGSRAAGPSSSSDRQAELPAGAYTVETLLFCGLATAIALSVTDLGEGGGRAAAAACFMRAAAACASCWLRHAVCSAVCARRCDGWSPLQPMRWLVPPCNRFRH